MQGVTLKMDSRGKCVIPKTNDISRFLLALIIFLIIAHEISCRDLSNGVNGVK